VHNNRGELYVTEIFDDLYLMSFSEVFHQINNPQLFTSLTIVFDPALFLFNINPSLDDSVIHLFSSMLEEGQVEVFTVQELIQGDIIYIACIFEFDALNLKDLLSEFSSE
jgi:hypothetical protein